MAGPATTKGPVQASVISQHGSDSQELKGRLDPITKNN